MKTMTDLRHGALALGLAMALGGVAPAGAQQKDARWFPWIGCWEPTNATPEADLVCVRPSEGVGSVEILRVKGTEVVGRETVWTDGIRHESTHETCKGWDEGAFSDDGRRIFLRSSYACGEGVTQEGGAILAFTSPSEWLDVRAAGMGGRSTAWVQRFRPAEAALVEAAGFGDLAPDRAWSARNTRLAAAAALEVEDVIEATGKVPAEAVRAFLAEQGSPLELSADKLIRMADAGVPETIIDVAVAVSYPNRFTLKGGGRQVVRTALDEGSLRRRWAYRGYAGPGFYDPFFAPWSIRYGYGYGYGYYGFGYDPYSYGWGYNPYGWSYGGYYGYTPVVVDPNRTQPEHGRVIRSRGYSRGGSSGGASPGSGSSPYPTPIRSQGTSGVSSSGGYTSGGASSGSDAARTAKPRGGG